MNKPNVIIDTGFATVEGYVPMDADLDGEFVLVEADGTRLVFKGWMLGNEDIRFL